MRFLGTIPLLLALLTPLRATEENPREILQDAWQDAVLLLYDDAQRILRNEVKDGLEDPREWRFGQAITLLNVQPKTDANVPPSPR